MSEIITAAITGCVTLLGVLLSNRAAQAVTDEKLTELTREVREHNHFAWRVPVVEEQIRGMDRRVGAVRAGTAASANLLRWRTERRVRMDISAFGMAGVAAITVICYLVGWIVKVSGLDNKWIPVIVGVCGGILGVVGMLVMTDFPAADPLTAAAVGIVSGLAATGVDQISKQMKD